MKGIIAAFVVFIISIVFGQFIDQIVDGTIATSTGLVSIPLIALKILLGLPTDTIGWILKLFVLAGIAIGGDAI